MSAWSTSLYDPGTSGLISKIVAPPGGTTVVWTEASGGEAKEPSS
jgi:hypothetical protein